MPKEAYERQKYNFHVERRKRELPEDINIIVEDIALKYGNNKLLKEMQRVHRHKLFGEIEYWSPDFRLKLANFDFADGICKTYRLAMYDGNPYTGTWKSGDCHVIFHDNRLNYVIDIRKPKEGEQ